MGLFARRFAVCMPYQHYTFTDLCQSPQHSKSEWQHRRITGCV